VSSPPGIFARLLSVPKARQGWEAARSCVSRKTKPAKIDSLKEKIFCARPLKEKEIFAGFVRRQAASRLGGISALQGRNSCSKKVRASFSNCVAFKKFNTLFGGCKWAKTFSGFILHNRLV
jgi:hypothetical protein